MKRICLYILISVSVFSGLFSDSRVYAESEDEVMDIPQETEQEFRKADDSSNKLRNINVDSEFMYGQYNNISANFTIMQGLDNLAYQFNADFKRSNDFGYVNSSYYDNSIEFTCQTDPLENLTIVPSVDVRNYSHGMYSNQAFSREEKDRLIVLLKNEYKPTPVRWQLNAGGTHYIHRLVGADTFETQLIKLNQELEWEMIVSPSQKVSLYNYTCEYFYDDPEAEFQKDKADNDYHSASELTWSIKLFEYLKLSLSPWVFWNKDSGCTLGYRAGLDSDSFRYLILGISCSREVIPFQPEELYFQQNYIIPYLSLPPSTVNRQEFTGSFVFRKKSAKDIDLKSVRIKTRTRFERSSNFCNYENYGNLNLISAGTVRTDSFISETEASAEISLSPWILSVSGGYTFAWYKAEKNINITYRPAHIFNESVVLNARRWNVTWKNEISSSMFINTTSKEKLNGTVIGSLGAQYQVAETVFANVKINNLYNSSYCRRPGYPEPGFTILGGLRIVF